MSLAEVENMAALQLFSYSSGVRGYVPQRNICYFRCSEVHFGAFWCILRHTEKHRPS